MATTPNTVNKKKQTKREIFEELKALPIIAQNPKYVEFIDHELELLAKKSAGKDGEKKQNAQQKENEAVMGEILNYMEMGTSYTISHLLENVPNLPEGMSHHRMVSIISKLCKDKALIRSKGKGGVTLFTLSE